MLQRYALAVSLESFSSGDIWLFTLAIKKFLTLFSDVLHVSESVGISKTNEAMWKMTKCKMTC